jgi:hypothetical protein
MYNNGKRWRKCIFPGYRWCGPGCSGPGAPINDVDACCKAHDLCIKRNGISYKCDRMFADCLRPKVNFHSRKGRTAALMYGYMKLQMGFGRLFEGR